MRILKRAFVGVSLATFAFIGLTQTVQAAMIGTEQIHAANVARSDHARIHAEFDRPEVVAHLERMGVTREDARARVAALSDEEAATLASQIDSMPAAGGDVVGALVLIFVVLLVTDILGLTKVFPFTRSRR